MSKHFFIQIIFFALFSSLIINNGFSQDDTGPDIEYGEYSVDELKSNSFGADTTAPAVILYDLGEAYFNDQLIIEFKRHVRIKIFNKAGYEWATQKIFYRYSKYRETVQDIEGYTAYLDENGNIVKQELDDDNIFDEKLDNIRAVKTFTLPSLRPGCIIEYRIKIKTEYMMNFPRQWNFQYSIPVVWSEYRTRIPGIYQFVSYEQKSQPFFINETEKFNHSYTPKDVTGLDIVLSGFSHRMVMLDLPALHNESFMKSIDDYRAKVVYQLASYNPPYASSQKFLRSWDELGKELMDDDDFGERIEKTDFLTGILVKIIDPNADEDQKLLTIYQYVANSIVWDGDHSIYASDLESVFEKKKGDGGDINLFLTALLKSAGIAAYPVILSTRDHGVLYTEYPILRQFNDVIVYAKTGTNEYILDATDKTRPYFLLPKEALNDTGLLILDDKVEWVNILPAGKDLNIKQASIAINPDGSLNGIIRLTVNDYPALSARHKMESESADLFLNETLGTDKTGISASSIKLTNQNDIEKPFIVDANISSKSYSQVFDNFIYANPNFLGFLQENPFKSENRTFPINYAYTIDHYYKVNINLPDGYDLKDYPKSQSIKLGKGDAGFTREVTLNGNTLQFSTRFYVNKISFKPEDYNELKKFYDQVVTLEAEQLVLEKKN